MVISVHIATHAQIAEPLFCNFHNEAFGIIIKLRERKEAGPSRREFRSVLFGSQAQLSMTTRKRTAGL